MLLLLIFLLLMVLLLMVLLLLLLVVLLMLLMLWAKVEGPGGGRAERGEHGTDVILGVVMEVLGRMVARRCLSGQRGWDQFCARILSPGLPCGGSRMDGSGVVLMMLLMWSSRDRCWG
jgi:hypothetical protein